MPRPPSNGAVTSPYGMRINPNDGKYRMHYGEDTIGIGNFAPVTGTVVFAGFDNTGTGLGWCVGIRQASAPTVIWWIAHHGAKGSTKNPLHVQVNDLVDEGAYLGPKGDSGAAQGVHCHTERRERGAPRPGSGTATNPREFYTSTAGGDVTPFDPTAPDQEEDTMYIRTPAHGHYAATPGDLISIPDPNILNGVQFLGGKVYDVAPQDLAAWLFAFSGCPADQIPPPGYVWSRAAFELGKLEYEPAPLDLDAIAQKVSAELADDFAAIPTAAENADAVNDDAADRLRD